MVYDGITDQIVPSQEKGTAVQHFLQQAGELAREHPYITIALLMIVLAFFGHPRARPLNPRYRQDED